MNINDIKEILVTFNDGTQQLFRDKGKEKFRRQIKTSPPLKGTIQIINQDDDDEDIIAPQRKRIPQRTALVESKEDIQKLPSSREKTVMKKKKSEEHPSGYMTTGVSYKPANGKCPMDLAREMSSRSGLETTF